MTTQEMGMTRNMGNVDRSLRAALGLALIAATVFGFIGAWGWLGVVPLVTAFFGSCPAYVPFGFSTCAVTPGDKPRVTVKHKL
jgi:fatty acid desaturase